MRLLAITGSPVRNGNLETLTRLALEALEGEAVARLSPDEEISSIHYRLYDLEIRPCVACARCSGSYRCTIRDDVDRLIAEIKEADLTILGTPVYWFSVSGMLKHFLDRTNSQWYGKGLAGQKLAALMTQGRAGAEQTEELLQLYAKHQGMEWVGSYAVTTRDHINLVLHNEEIQGEVERLAAGWMERALDRGQNG
ncbi:MAG: flavodoxin family protein [Bacillota bacterium]